jgi:uncharacterized repeat protein (TIGR01451 family)
MAPAGAVTCTIPALAPGAETEIKIAVVPTTPGIFTNIAEAEAVSDQTQSNPVDASATTRVVPGVEADLRVYAVAPEETDVGQLVSYRIVVVNFGPTAASAARLYSTVNDNVDILSFHVFPSSTIADCAEVEAGSGQTKLVCPLFGLTVESLVFVVINVKPTAPGTLDNLLMTATVSHSTSKLTCH